MSKLTVPLTAITSEGISFDAAVSESEIRPRGVEALALSEVRVHGILSQAGGEYIFRGRLSGRYAHPCDRCLVPVDEVYDVEALWVFVESRASSPSPSDEEQAEEEETVFRIEGTEIDLAPRIWEEAALAVPAKVLCKEDCAGLCPQCGADLNRGTCSCRETKTMDTKRLAKLAELFPDLAKPSKE